MLKARSPAKNQLWLLPGLLGRPPEAPRDEAGQVLRRAGQDQPGAGEQGWAVLELSPSSAVGQSPVGPLALGSFSGKADGCVLISPRL